MLHSFEQENAERCQRFQKVKKSYEGHSQPDSDKTTHKAEEFYALELRKKKLGRYVFI